MTTFFTRVSVAVMLLLAAVEMSAIAQTGPGTAIAIDSTVVTARRRTSGIKGDLAKGLEIKMSTLATFPKMLGTADPLKFAQALPGVTSNSDWESGFRVQGCEASQSVTKLCDVPVYGQGHILGLFSVFNPGHFKNMQFNSSSQARRVGGELKLDTSDTLSTRLHGEGNLGPVSTHATFSFPVGKKSSLTLSGRRSFVDVFYKNLFEVDGVAMNYYFYDLNGSFLAAIDDYNTLDANFYLGRDYGAMNVDAASSGIGASWGNLVGNLRWRHNKGGLKLMNQLYISRYDMNGNLGITQNSGQADDEIIDVGLESSARWHSWDFVAEFDWYGIQPQNISDGSSTAVKTNILPRQNSLLGTLRAGYRFSPGDWTINPKLACSCYYELGIKKLYPRIDPELTVDYNMYRNGKITLDAGLKHQYLFMTGMTSSGFPVEFWLGVGEWSDPQTSLYGTLSYSVDLFHNALTINTQAYGKRLWNLVEYSGFLSDMIGGNYDLKKMLLPGNGWNYGASVQIQKNSGALTGWVCYTWGRAMRKFDKAGYGNGIYPSSHERIHELNAVASYRIRRWEFGGNFIFASGVPYTPVTAAYYMNEKLMVKYGEFNSCRLSPYIRLDLSASFNIRNSGRFRDGINISVQNVTARRNQLMATLKVRNGEYSYAPVQLIIPVLPSINYYCYF